MSHIRINKKTSNFTVLDNTCLKDKELSWKSKGLLAYLLHLPDDWQINIKDLGNRSKDGITAVRSSIDELIRAGYIKRERVYKNGKFLRYDYNVYEKPLKSENLKSENLKSENLKSENLKSENLTLLNTNNNQELNKENTKNTKRESAELKIFKKYKKEFEGLLPIPVKLTQMRKDRITARINEYDFETVNETWIQKLKKARFLHQSYKEGAKWLNFDWLVNPNNFVKILEDKYIGSEMNNNKESLDPYAHLKRY